MKIFIAMFFLCNVLFANIGTIAMLKGDATITRGEKSIEAKIGGEIEEGDKIDTYAKTRLQIILNDESVITLGKNTEYVFDSFGDENDPHAQMSINRGYMKAITGKLGKLAPERFKLKTKSATIGIRGTGWKTFVGLNIENHLCFKGAITVITPTQTIDIPAGTMALMTDGAPKKYKANIKFFNAQIKAVEAKQKDKEKPNSEKAPESKNSSDINKKEAPERTMPTALNTPPEIEMEIGSGEADLGTLEEIIVDDVIIEEDVSKIEQDSVVDEVINEVTKAFDITPKVITPEPTLPDPTTGP